MVADRISSYIQQKATLNELVDWAENALMEDHLEPDDASDIAAVLARLGVADVRMFGLSWEDCQELLGHLGFTTRVEIVAR